MTRHEIRDLPLSLSDEAIALWHRVGLTRPWNDPAQDLRNALDGPASTVLAAVATRDPAHDPAHDLADDPAHDPAHDPAPPRLLGTAMVGVDGHRGWMYYLAVDPDGQRSGLGTELVRAAEQWVSDRGIPKLMLMVREDNADVLRFYAHLGYEVNQVATLGRRLDGTMPS